MRSAALRPAHDGCVRMKFVLLLLVVVGLPFLTHSVFASEYRSNFTDIWAERIQNGAIDKILNTIDSDPRWAGYSVCVNSSLSLPEESQISTGGSFPSKTAGEVADFLPSPFERNISDIMFAMAVGERTTGTSTQSKKTKSVTTGRCNISVDGNS